MKPLKPSQSYPTSVRTPTTTRLPTLSHREQAIRKGFTTRTAAGASRPAAQARGLLELLESGAIGADTDLEPFLTSEGPMRSHRVPLHKPTDRHHKPPPVMTDMSGFNAVRDYRLDMLALSRIPAALNLEELKGWEAAEQARRDQQQQQHSVAAFSTPSPPPATALDAQPTSSTAPAPEAASSGIIVAGGGTREDTRTYTELLDLYSMHEFVIRKGKTLRNTPEFASFKRHYRASWGEIESLVEALENLLTNLSVEVVYVDGKKLAQLASYQAPDLLTPTDLAQCIANAEAVLPLIADASRPYSHGPRRYHIAATKIQATWRMCRQRIAYMHLLIGTRAAIAIQRQWAMHRAHSLTRRTIGVMRDTQLLRWRRTMDDFRAAWPDMEESRRTVVHIPSLSYPAYQSKKVPFFDARQLGQLPRLAALADPLVHLVFVVPVKPDVAMQQYYLSLLEESSVANVSSRLTYVVPENASRLPPGLSLTRMALLSPRLLKLLSALCTGKPAFIVPAVVGPEELTLASQLNIPLLSAEPRLVQTYGSKSGCRRLLEAADVLTPPGASQLHSRQDLFQALSNLVVEHRSVSRWLIKLENEFGSRGHAYLDVGRLRTLQEADVSATAAAGALASAIAHELETQGEHRVRLLHHSVYPDWDAYLNMFDAVGGVVEAVQPGSATPVTANLFVAPSGAVRLESVVEPLLAPAMTVMATLYPPRSSIPYAAIRGASLSVGHAASRKRIMGYISVDYVVTTDAPGCASSTTEATSNMTEPPRQRLWGVDVDFGLTPSAAAHGLAVVVTGSVWDGKYGTCVSALSGKPLVYVYSGILYSPCISAIREASFFLQCQSKGLAYDAGRHTGIIFHFLNALQCNCVGAISIGSDEARAVRRLTDFQSLLNMALPKQGDYLAESNCVYFSSLVRQLSQLLR